ncbi:co-chaperone GroES, partial [Salmonella enterica subsp. enterica serovar Goldcoast]|nr:co-chaperone GroES [Salmonella enterica subsp. enterica serovar Goldcoast]
MGKREISSVFTAFFAQKNFFSSPPL